MPADSFSTLADNAVAPARAPFSITPHNTNELAALPKALYIGTGGDVTLRGADAIADVVFKNVPGGTTLDVRASHVRATGTSAADIVGLA